MEHLIVRFADGLPRTIQRLGGKEYFTIPKAQRFKALQFMVQHPRQILKKRKSFWEVIGTPPLMQQRGGNNYNSFLRGVKKVLAHAPEHELGSLPLLQLQKDPRIKGLYERHFKRNPELLNHDSIINVVASDLLNYDGTTGAVRDSIADVRKKKRLPPSSIPLEITKENEFDRLLLLHIDQFLVERKIPVLFLKSNYFTLRPQLLQVYQDDQSGFRGRIEQINHHLQQQIWSDYSALVNETNRIYISRYPFEDGVRMIGITAHTPNYTAFRTKLRTITQLCLTIQGSANKFRGLDELTETYSKSLEAKLVNVDHFMRGVQGIMSNDKEFVMNLMKNSNRFHGKVVAILKGNSL